MQKFLLSLLLVLAGTISAVAQSYISYTRMESEDGFGDLGGAGGVMVLSKRSDLVITVDNAQHPIVTPRGKRADGLYAYEVVVKKDDNPTPKIEVSKRGDIDRTSFAVTTKKDYFLAYLIDEVQKPIRFEDHKQANDMITDKNSAVVEITTAITDLIIECPGELNAKVKTQQKGGSVIETEIIIPLANCKQYKEQVEQLQKKVELMTKELEADVNAGKLNDAAIVSRDELIEAEQKKLEEATEKFAEVSKITVYAKGTNKLFIDVSSLAPREKIVYGVLERTIIVKEHVSECSGFLEEGGRLFGLRQYKGAREAFIRALEAKDAPKNMQASIRSNILQCDSCILYDRYSKGALAKIKEMKDNGTGNQADLVKFASAASEFISQLNRYNPCEFYTSRIEKLDKMIEDMPLDIRFTIAKWVNDASGFYEDGFLGNVELWGCYSADTPKAADYEKDKNFIKMVSSNTAKYKRLGETAADGTLILHLVRKNLPVAIFFRPVGYGKHVKIKYLNMAEIMWQSKEEYNMRQFRMKMYYNKE